MFLQRVKTLMICHLWLFQLSINVSVYGTVYSLIAITIDAQCLSMYFLISHQEQVYNFIVITMGAKCLSMYLFMVLPSRKGLQSDCYYHKCSMCANVSVYGSPIKKGFTV